MLKFVKLSQVSPKKTDVLRRKNHFKEIYANYAKEKANEQSSRCSQCGIPFCQVHCPLHNNIPDWLKLTAEDRLKEAYELSSSTNNMPEVCGRICPQDKLCEGNCVIEQAGHGTVTIGSIEKYITDFAWESGWIKNIKVENEIDLSIGIIGSGPAGLAAAEELRKKGFQVSIYDRYDRAGGLLIYGIPNFKLEKHIVTRRVKRLKDSGISFILNCDIGNKLSFDEIKKKHNAILIATGVYKSRKINLNHNKLDNVIQALDFLIASNRKGLKDNVKDFDNGKLNCFNKDILVIGGGDTAMDCVRTAVRQGAKSVKCLYRRDQKNMPGSQREVLNAIEEGVEFKWLTQPIEYIGDDFVKKVKIINMQLDSIDQKGRQISKPIENSEEYIDTDIIIEALGFKPEDLPSMFNKKELIIKESGTLQIDNNMMTNLDGVFAAGDIVRGASLVVWGIKDGRDAAININSYLLEKYSKKFNNNENYKVANA